MKNKNLFKRIATVILCLSVIATASFTGLMVNAAAGVTIDFTGYTGNTDTDNNAYDSKAAYYWNDSCNYLTSVEDVTPTAIYGDLDQWIQPSNMGSYATISNTVYNNIAAISPKDASGNLVAMENFSATLNDIRVGHNVEAVKGAIWIGIRQQEPGKFLSGTDDYQFDPNQAFVRITNTGITIASGQELTDRSATLDAAVAEDYTFTDTRTTPYLRTENAKFDIKVKVVSGKCTVTVKDYWNANFTAETYTEELAATTPSSGYFSFGVGDTTTYAFDDVTVNELDFAGNEMGFDSTYVSDVQSVVSVERTVAVGAVLAEANLPDKVMVVDQNGYKFMASVNWDTAGADFSKVGIVTLNGTVSTDATMTNSQKIGATARVEVTNDTDDFVDTVEYDFKIFEDPSATELENNLANSFLTTYADWSTMDHYRTNLNYKDHFKNGNFGGYTLYNASLGSDAGMPIYGKVAGLTPKDANGNLLEYKNFELSFDYRVPGNVRANEGALWIVFHQQTGAGAEPGSIWQNDYQFKSDRSIVKVTNTGVSVRSDENNPEYDFYVYDTPTDQQEDKMTAESSAYLCKDGSLVTVKVRVFENICAVTIYKTDTNESLYTKEFTLNADAPRRGYVTLGIGNRVTQLSKLTIKKIGSEGFEKSLKPYDASLADSFLTTWNHEGTYKTVNYTDLFSSGWNEYTVHHNSGTYPMARTAEIYSRIAGLTPIDGNGKTAEVRNFELTFDYRMGYTIKNKYSDGSNAPCGAIIVCFRQKTAGQFTTAPWTYNKEQSVARVSATGITIASGSDLTKGVEKEDVAMSSDVYNYLTNDGSMVTIKVKVVGDLCEVGVYNTTTRALLASYRENIDPSARQNGYLTFGLADWDPQMINLSVKRLDESGNYVDFTQITKMGDANGDDDADILDLVKIKEYCNEPSTVILKKNADCDLSGILDILDLNSLKKILLNIA